MKSIRSVNPEKLLLEFFKSENISLKANGWVFAVCFSGGPDSTALLLLMHRLSIRYQFPLKAVHVRHNIRSEAESCAEEEFVRRFCRERNIEIHSESLPPGFLSQKLRECKRSPEEAARIERYRIFCKLKQEGFADWFLTAHHADDNRETVVQRIFEGAGLFGLKGIPRRNGFFLRPLLTVSKQTLIELLSENHLTGIFDSTNGDLSISRNRFRSTIAPFLDREVPGWKSGIDRLIEKVNAAAQALLRLPIETVIEKDGDGAVFIRRERWNLLLKQERYAVVYAALQSLLTGRDRERISFDFVRETAECLCGEKFYRGVRIRCDSDRILFSPPASFFLRYAFCFDVSEPGCYRFPGGVVTVRKDPFRDINADFSISVSEAVLPLFLRSFRFGDNSSAEKTEVPANDRFSSAVLCDRTGVKAVLPVAKRMTKNSADLEKNLFFNYYMEIRTEHGR